MRYPLADAGLPLLAFHLPAMLLLLLPIVAIECLFARLRLPKPLPPKYIRSIALANLASTLVGIPMAWAVVLAYQLCATPLSLFVPLSGPSVDRYGWLMVFLQPAWVGLSDDPKSIRLVPIGTLILLVPYFLVSVKVEAWMLRSYWPAVPPPTVLAATRIANLASYSLLPLVAAIWLVILLR